MRLFFLVLFEGDFLMLMTEFDLLSENIRSEITNKTQNTFAKVTADNITRVLHILASASDYGKVQISQLEVGMQLNLSQNRVSELLKLAKKTGLIGIDMICRCGDIRNEYTLLDNPIVNTIKRIVFKSSQADPRASIDLALSNTMSFYRLDGEQEHILEQVKNRMPIDTFIKATGIFEYFRKTLKTLKKELAEPVEASTYKKNSKQGGFNDYEQRPFDKTLEKQLLETGQVEVSEEPFSIQALLKKSRE